ncbi:MAG: YfbK domain-containing protein [Christensenellales bacterium]|jgi:Ca-activated chloride channel family protein
MHNTQTIFHKPAALLMALLMALFLALPALGAPFTQELRPGDSGEEVLAMQTRLKELGYFTGRPDGKFDDATRAALIRFQQDNNLLATGTLDSHTHRALYAQDAKPFRPVADENRVLDSAPLGTLVYSTSAQGAGWSPMNTNEYDVFNENRFLSVATSPLSTFAADVDTASYAQLRAKILRGEAVPPDSVRIEEMLNYFRYSYKQPAPGEPFGVTMELAKTPWNEDTWLLLIGLQAEEIKREERPPQNLVFLIDVSGSMDMPDKLPLVKRAFLMLLEELSPTDTVSIVTYASRDEVVLSGRPAADKVAIMEAINALEAGGSTAGAAGITTAYELAREHFIEGGNNRVLLATDGDLNVGVTDEGSLARMVEEKKQGGIFLSVLGFGDGNYKDNKLEALADRGDGNYSYIDTIHEARRALVTEIGATFYTVARDVKLQVDFNPAHLKGYRLIGYENRVMAAEDFADDTKDGGELGSGHRLTVLYELVSADSEFDIGEVASKYWQPAPLDSPALSDELLTLSIRAKAPTGDESALYTYPVKAQAPGEMTDNLRFAAAVAEVGMLLRDSEWKGSATYDSALKLLRADSSLTGDPYREEFLYLVNLLNRGN